MSWILLSGYLWGKWFDVPTTAGGSESSASVSSDDRHANASLVPAVSRDLWGSWAASGLRLSMSQCAALTQPEGQLMTAPSPKSN